MTSLTGSQAVKAESVADLLRAGGAKAGPVLEPAREFVMAHRRRRATFTGIPTPHHELVGGNVLDDLRDGLAVVLFWIFYLPADLSGRAAFPDHRHVGRRRQMPVWRAGRHVQSGDIMLLMTGGALLSKLAFPIRSATDILNVYVSIVTLARKVTSRMTIETTRMLENRNDGDKEFTCPRVVVLKRAARCLGWK